MPSGVDSVHVAALDDLRSLKLDGGRLLLELTSGEKYAFPVAELMSGGQDKTLQLRETLPGRPAPFGGLQEKIRLHEVQLARLASVRLVAREEAPAPA